MYSAIFEEMGLSPNEAKIYETLLSTGKTSVSQISVNANIHRRNIYDAINRLVQKGLVSPIFQKGENQYQAVHPDKLIEIVKEKENKLSAILPELRKKYGEDSTEEAAYIYKGKEGFKNYVRDVLRLEEDLYSLGAKGLLHNLSKELSKDLWQAVKQKKFKTHTLYDPKTKALLPEVIKNEGGLKKILPPEYATDGVLDIFGDHVVTFANVEIGQVFDDTTIFVMINKQLAESYRTWFKFIWDKCPNI